MIWNFLFRVIENDLVKRFVDVVFFNVYIWFWLDV